MYTCPTLVLILLNKPKSGIQTRDFPVFRSWSGFDSQIHDCNQRFGSERSRNRQSEKPLKDKSEFKVKWASLRLLNALAREYPNIIQQVIQERPTGVSSLGFGSNHVFGL